MTFRFLILFVWLLGAGTASAVQVGVYHGFWAPRNFGDGYGPGVSVGWGTYPQDEFSLRLAMFPSFNRTEGTESGPVQLELEVIPVEGAYMFPITPPGHLIRGYLGGGLGYYVASLESRGPAGTLSTEIDDHFGWLAGGGVTLEVNPTFSLFGEMFFRGILGSFDDGKLTRPEFSNDIDFSGLSINLGMTFRW